MGALLVKLSKKQRQELRMKFGGYCAYCGQLLPEKGWHADHANPVVRISKVDYDALKKGVWKLKATGECHYPENDNFENMMPSCAYCNINKSALDIEGFRVFVSTRIEMLMKTTNGKMSVKYGLIELKPRPIVFWFEIYPLIVQNNS